MINNGILISKYILHIFISIRIQVNAVGINACLVEFLLVEFFNRLGRIWMS